MKMKTVLYVGVGPTDEEQNDGKVQIKPESPNKLVSQNDYDLLSIGAVIGMGIAALGLIIKKILNKD